MSTSENEVSRDLLDIDLSDATSPSAYVTDGTYRLQLREMKPRTSSGGNPMVECQWMTQHPDTKEMVFIRDYPMLSRQDGKFRLNQIFHAAGVPARPTPENCAAVVAANLQVDAELKVEESADYGTQNKIKRLLVDLKK